MLALAELMPWHPHAYAVTHQASGMQLWDTSRGWWGHSGEQLKSKWAYTIGPGRPFLFVGHLAIDALACCWASNGAVARLPDGMQQLVRAPRSFLSIRCVADQIMHLPERRMS